LILNERFTPKTGLGTWKVGAKLLRFVFYWTDRAPAEFCHKIFQVIRRAETKRYNASNKHESLPSLEGSRFISSGRQMIATSIAA
jgi:hypothetical protein